MFGSLLSGSNDGTCIYIFEEQVKQYCHTWQGISGVNVNLCEVVLA